MNAFKIMVAEGHEVDILTGMCSCGDPFCLYMEERMGYQRNQSTESDYDFYEVSSALQKMVRRGKEEEAIYWALELEPYYHKYMWKRLTVMVHEEIGIANPMAPVILNTYKEQYYQLRETKAKERFLVVANTILFLCREPKCRIGDDFINVALREERTKEIPDAALDAHTLRGKRMGRGWDKDGDEFWYTVSSIVENEVPGLNTYLRRRKFLTESKVPIVFNPEI